jgi:hypothetical protein
MEEAEVYLDISTVRKIAAIYFNVEESLFDIDTQEHEIVVRRQIVHALCFLFTKNTLAEIGTAVGKRDHATVHHSKKTINDLVDTDHVVRKWYTDLSSIIKKMMKDPGYIILLAIRHLKKSEELFKVNKTISGMDYMMLQLHGMIITLEEKAKQLPGYEEYLLSVNQQHINIQEDEQG